MFYYILNQEESSLLFKMLMTQKEKPVKNNFYSYVMSILSEIGIQISKDQIKSMKQNVFKELVKIHCNKSVFTYLQEKQQRGSKGRSIKYTCLRMQDYLLPQSNIYLKDQREIFSIRCKTNPLGANRGIIEYCETKYGAIIDNAHIFQFPVLNQNETSYNF